jgi:hypothetical protein
LLELIEVIPLFGNQSGISKPINGFDQATHHDVSPFNRLINSTPRKNIALREKSYFGMKSVMLARIGDL